MHHLLGPARSRLGRDAAVRARAGARVSPGVRGGAAVVWGEAGVPDVPHKSAVGAGTVV